MPFGLDGLQFKQLHINHQITVTTHNLFCNEWYDVRVRYELALFIAIRYQSSVQETIAHLKPPMIATCQLDATGLAA